MKGSHEHWPRERTGATSGTCLGGVSAGRESGRAADVCVALAEHAEFAAEMAEFSPFVDRSRA